MELRTGIVKACLVFRCEEEFPVRLLEMCKAMADRYSRRPAFRHCSSEQILDYLLTEVFALLNIHGVERRSFDSDATLGTFYAIDVSVNYDGMCCDLAAAAFEHFALVCHPSDYSTQVPASLPLNQKSGT